MQEVNLNELNVGPEINPFSYSPDDYPAVDQVLEFILSNTSKPAVNISLEELSLNGTVIKDSMEEYLSKKMINSSSLKEALKSPLAFLYEYEKTFLEKKKKAHFELGTFAHMAFLEPELFDKVAVEPDYNISSKEGILKMIKFYRELCGRKNIQYAPCNWKMNELRVKLDNLKKACPFQIIQPEHAIIIRALKNNYYWYGKGIIPLILKGAISETSFYGKDPETGLEVKIRPDFFNIEENIGVNAIISYKTTRADSIGKFAYDCAKHMYELSEGMYLEMASHITGRQFNTTIMIMLQTIPPYQPAVLFWSADDLQNGKYKYHQAMSIVKECFDKKSFQIGFDAKAPEGQCGIIDFELPEWSRREIYPTAIDDEYPIDESI